MANILETKNILPKYASHGYWNNFDNHKAFLDDLARKLNITTPQGWFSIRNPTLIERGGGGLLRKYNGSLSRLLSTVYPEYRQTCKQALMQLAHDLNTNSVKDLLYVGREYLFFQ